MFDTSRELIPVAPEGGNIIFQYGLRAWHVKKLLNIRQKYYAAGKYNKKDTTTKPLAN